MSRYKLRANYDIENIDSQKMDGTVIVDVPMLSNGELNYRQYLRKNYSVICKVITNH